MDLKNRQITVGELLDDPRSRAVFQRRFGQWMSHPLVNASRGMTLARLTELAKAKLPPGTIAETLAELERL